MSRTPIQASLDRLQAGDPSARESLFTAAQDRLLTMVRSMLRQFPNVRQWEESDDVLQNVAIRMSRCLDQVPLDSTRAFLAIAATNIRRELIDLARRHAANRMPGLGPATATFVTANVDWANQPDQRTTDPAVLADWAALHEIIAALPDAEREVVDLHWYHGLTQVEVAELIGVDVRTVKRRWLAAKLLIGRAFDRDLSE